MQPRAVLRYTHSHAKSLTCAPPTPQILGQGASPILPSPELTPEVVAQWMAACDALVSRALQAATGSGKE
jgi:hypothetical protein